MIHHPNPSPTSTVTTWQVLQNAAALLTDERDNGFLSGYDTGVTDMVRHLLGIPAKEDGGMTNAQIQRVLRAIPVVEPDEVPDYARMAAEAVRLDPTL